MIDNKDEFTRQFLQLIEGADLSMLLVALAFGLTLVVGIVLNEIALVQSGDCTRPRLHTPNES